MEAIKREADTLQDAWDKVTAGNWSLETAVKAADSINAGMGRWGENGSCEYGPLGTESLWKIKT